MTFSAPGLLLRASLLACLGATGCASYNVGSRYEAEPNGSYAGQTLNPSVGDQNPHVGGDASFPSADVTTDHPPPGKLDGR